MLAEIVSQLGIDQTFFIQFGIVTVLYFVLSPTYIKPFQKLIERRDGATTGSRKEIDEMVKVYEDRLLAYKSKVKEANAAVRHDYKLHEAESQRQAAQVMQDAVAESRARIQRAQAEIKSQEAAIVSELSSESTLLAKDIVAKVLGLANS